MSNSQQDKPDQTSSDDWGLHEPGHGQRSQIRVALIMIVSLLGALGYFVYRKYDERGAGVVQAADFRPDQPESAPEPDATGTPEAAPSPTPALDLFGPLEGDAETPNPNRTAAAPAASEVTSPTSRSEPPIVDWSLQPIVDAAPEPQSPDQSGNLNVSTEQPVPLQRGPREELIPADSEQAVDLFGMAEGPSAAQTTDAFEQVPADQPVVDDAQDSGLFGLPEEPPTLRGTSTVEPAPGAQPRVDGAQATDRFGHGEEPTTAEATGRTETVPAGSPASATPQAVDPFALNVEAGTSEAADADAPASDLFLRDAPPPEPDAASWEDELPARPTTAEPITVSDVEISAGRQAEPEVIRVNSDDQIGEATQPAALFEDPYFQEEETPHGAPSGDSPGAPATLDFGTPASPVPGPQPSPAPSPAVDWSSPTDAFVGSGTPAPSPFESGPTTTSARDSDPFAEAAASSPNAAGRFDESARVHTVQRGDSYWSIARHYYNAGRYFRALAAYNRPRIADPEDLRPGMKVIIPEADVLQQRYPALLGGSYVPGRRMQTLPAGFFMSREGQPMYRVGRNDTLSSIAEAHLGRASRWRQIYGMNRTRLQDADHLQPGLELRLPPDASQAELVSRPAGFR